MQMLSFDQKNVINTEHVFLCKLEE